MEEIKIYKKIDIVNPVMIAGWPGMGSVAIGVVDYLRRSLSAVKFAEIRLDPAHTIDSVMVEDGLAKIPPVPKNIFYYTRKPDLVICEGQAQLAGQQGVNLLSRVLDLASDIRVKSIYTGAAFPAPVSHKDEPQVYVAVNNKAMLPAFSSIGIKAMESGHISGLNGLVLGFARSRRIDALCLLATMPQYAISLPNPKAVRAIIDVLQKTLNFHVNLSEIDDYAREMDEKMSLIEDKVKDVFAVDRQEPESAHFDKKVPDYIIDKIERLFLEARLDRPKAIMLKEELDRWDLYKMYEDRFLDLFKDSQ